MKKEHLKIEISRLWANPKNPKMHDDKLIKESIQDLGFVDDIVVDENNVILSGHGRLKALKELGTKDGTEIDVIRVSGWTQEQKDRYLLLSNKSVEKGGWDFEMLAQIDKELLKQVGFESQELDKIFKDLNKDDDEVPEVPEKPTSKLGDIYQLGNHRLMCGDSTRKEDVEKLMNGVKANMVFTDPPYGVNYDGGTTKRDVLIGDKTPELYLPSLKNIYEFSEDKMALYLWFAGLESKSVFEAVFEAVFEIRSLIIWNKNQAQYGSLSAQYKQKHEPLLYCYKKGKSPNWYGGTREVTVWDCNRSSINKYHPTQKPIELAERAITNSSKRGDIVLDLFGGSGSTLIACEQLDRKCYMMELDPRYTDVIIKRWENFTKLKAKKL